MTAPLIAVVADRKSATSGAWVEVPTDGLPHTYLAAIEEAGGAPLLVPSLDVHRSDPARIVAIVDGLFLPGGRDLDAELYDSDSHPENDVPLRARDDLEIALVREARRRGIPIFGACRGLQVINVALGGTLEQHLADRVDMTPHRDVVGNFTSHPVTVVPDSRLAGLTHQQTFEIASHHHQGIGVLGRGLVVSAFAPDGVVEAIETRDGAFCVGVQWHPEERLYPEGLALVRAFVDAAGQRVPA